VIDWQQPAEGERFIPCLRYRRDGHRVQRSNSDMLFSAGFL